MQVVWFLANDSLNFTGRGRQGRRGEGRKNHGYFREMGMLRLWTMRGGFQHTHSAGPGSKAHLRLHESR